MWIANGNLLFLIIYTSFAANCLCDVQHILNNQINHRPQNEYHNARIENDHHHHNHYHGQDGKYNPNDDGTGWDIRLSVPGEPDLDYPVLNSVPRTSFNCIGKKSGYYADTQARCQVFRVCANTAPSGFFSFLCPNGTLFNQQYMVCDWWMNVRCMDTEKYSNSYEGTAMKSGPAMMADIKSMIMYPMTNPYNGIPPEMKILLQVYNPPDGMVSELQQTINSQYTNQLNENLKYSGFYRNNIKTDSHSSGSSTVVGNSASSQYQGAIPANHSPVYKETTGNSFFTRENFGGLSLKKSFDSNTEQAIKITKQQFTYPSRFDKQYTVTVPKTPTVQPLIVHVPINIPATDQTYNGVPISTANEIYEAQKISSEKVQSNQFFVKKNYNDVQSTNTEYQNDIQNTINLNKQDFGIKDDFLGISEKTSSNYQLLHQKDVSGYNHNSVQSAERGSHATNIHINKNTASNSVSQSNLHDDSGGSFYSLQHPIYHYVKIPNGGNEHLNSFKSTNETKNQSGNINYSVKNYKSTSEHVLSTVQTSIKHSDYAETKGFQSSNSTFTKIHTTNVPTTNNVFNDRSTNPYNNIQFKNTHDYSKSIVAPTTSNTLVENKFNSSFYHSINNVPYDSTPQQKITSHQDFLQNNKELNYQTDVNQNQAIEKNPVIYSNQDSSNSNNQMAQYSQFVNIPSNYNGNLEHVQLHYENQKKSQSQPSTQSNSDQRVTYTQVYNINPNSQYQTEENRYLSNQNSNFKASDQQHMGEYTTVEVVPALGFAIDSVHERQAYYDALSKGLQDVQKKYQAPYTHDKMYTSTYNGNVYSQSVENAYDNAAYNVNHRQNINKDNQYVQYQNQPNYNGAQYEPQNRVIHGQIIAHPQTQGNYQSSLPLEDLGYLRDKPNVPFTY